MLKCEQREARFTISTPGDRPRFIIHCKVQGSAPRAENKGITMLRQAFPPAWHAYVRSERLAVTTPGNGFQRCSRKVDQRKGKGSS